MSRAVAAPVPRVVLWCCRPLPGGGGWTTVLSPGETARAASFRLAADHDRFVTARALVRAAVGEARGVPPAEVDLRVGDARDAAPGRPTVPGGPAVSIAHAGAWVLAAVLADPDARVGADVEAVAAVAAHRQGVLAVLPASERPRAGWAPVSLTRAWVRREALLKAVGTGLRADRDDLVLGRADGPAVVRRTRPPLPAVDGLRLLDVRLLGPPDHAGDHRAAVAVHRPGAAHDAVPVVVADGGDLLARTGVPPAR